MLEKFATQHALDRAQWHKPSRSTGPNTGCMEHAVVHGTLNGAPAQLHAVRDTQTPGSATLLFTEHEWDCARSAFQNEEF